MAGQRPHQVTTSLFFLFEFSVRNLSISIVKSLTATVKNLSCPNQGVVLEASKLKQNMVTGLGAVDVDNAYHLQRKASDVAFQTKPDEPPVWIALDEVVDPQNLGAILRTSMFMGVDGVIVCHKNSAPLSAVVAKASAGALEVRPTYGVTSLMKFIKVKPTHFVFIRCLHLGPMSWGHVTKCLVYFSFTHRTHKKTDGTLWEHM